MLLPSPAKSVSTTQPGKKSRETKLQHWKPLVDGDSSEDVGGRLHWPLAALLTPTAFCWVRTPSPKTQNPKPKTQNPKPTNQPKPNTPNNPKPKNPELLLFSSRVCGSAPTLKDPRSREAHELQEVVEVQSALDWE